VILLWFLSVGHSSKCDQDMSGLDCISRSIKHVIYPFKFVINSLQSLHGVSRSLSNKRVPLNLKSQNAKKNHRKCASQNHTAMHKQLGGTTGTRGWGCGIVQGCTLHSTDCVHAADNTLNIGVVKDVGLVGLSETSDCRILSR
jgi:hypothetical protein